jgi:nucleoside-diphosphate-sugar epimerase
VVQPAAGSLNTCRQILVTGGTGALGLPLVAELLRAGCAHRIGILIRPGPSSTEGRFGDLVVRLQTAGVSTQALFPVAGDLVAPSVLDKSLLRETEVIVHAAADTRFRAPERAQHETNVLGTRRALEWASDCPRLRHFVLASTTCVAGTRAGPIPETRAPEPPGFINSYERTKWQAEQLAFEAGLPVHVVRLSTCTGAALDGSVERPGALHRALKWFYRGLVPMVPGSGSSRVDLIPTDTAAAFLARAVCAPASGVSVYQVAAGEQAAPLALLLAFLVELFGETHAGWRRGQIPPPLIVDVAAFNAFQRSVEQSRDRLLSQVMESVDSFLPALLYPKTYETKRAEQFWGGPLPVPDWRETIRSVVQFCLRANWGRTPVGDFHHAG